MKRLGYILQFLFVLNFLSGFASAEDFVCSQGEKFLRYHAGVERSQTDISECSKVPDSFVPSQRMLMGHVPVRYLKVVNGLAVEMSAGEKAILDAPLLAEQTRQAALEIERQSNPACNADPNVLEQRYTDALQAAGTAAQRQQVTEQVIRQLLRCNGARQ